MNKITTKFPETKVLIAEDYFVNQEVTHDILELMGCEVDVAQNGKEALEKHDQNRYDVILCHTEGEAQLSLKCLLKPCF